MPRPPMTVLSLPCCAALLTGCAAPAAPPPRLIARIERVAPPVPSSLLTCEPEPSPPAAGTQRDVADYIVTLWGAGADCRDKLARVKAVLQPGAAAGDGAW